MSGINIGELQFANNAYNDGVEFCLAAGQMKFTVGPGQVGHTHLTRQCPDQVRAVEEFNDRINFGPTVS
jgi:hypothetical protein